MRNLKKIFVSVSTALASLIYTKKRIQKTTKLRIIHSHNNAGNQFKRS
ncbi:hypothetical protein [Parafilimonas sp.]